MSTVIEGFGYYVGDMDANTMHTNLLVCARMSIGTEYFVKGLKFEVQELGLMETQPLPRAPHRLDRSRDTHVERGKTFEYKFALLR